MASLAFELLIPQRRLLAVEAAMVTLPGREGDVGVLPGHSPLICGLRPGGTLRVKTGLKTLTFTLTGGFAEALPDRCTVLADSAEPS